MRPRSFGFHIQGTHQARPAVDPQRGHLGQPERQDHRPGGPHSYDGAKRLQRRKRHLLVDTLGLVGRVQVTAADVGDRSPFLDWTRQRRGIAFQVMQRHDGGHKPRWLPPGATPPIVSSFAVVPRRCVVERTLAWLGRFRWLSKDYEIGRISRLLWRSLKAASRGRAPIWRGAITVTEPIGTASSAWACGSSSSRPAK
jgi:transposase